MDDEALIFLAEYGNSRRTRKAVLTKPLCPTIKDLRPMPGIGRS